MITTYSYDAANQLIAEETPSGTTSYTYDAAGNRRTVGGTRGREYVLPSKASLLHLGGGDRWSVPAVG